MELTDAEEHKTFVAEKQLAKVRAIVIVFGTLSYFFLDNPYIKERLVYILIAIIWSYGTYVFWFKPWEKYPVFLASWFTYSGDCLFATFWIYATGGFYSPYHVIYYTSVIAVAFRFGFRTTMFTSAVYAACYLGLLLYLNQLIENYGLALVRAGFIFIIGYLSQQITRETLLQTAQKLKMKKMAEEAVRSHRQLEASQKKLSELNKTLRLRNNIFKHSEVNAETGSYAWNLKTKKLQYSDNLFRLLGYEPGEFQPTIEKYYQFVVPEERAQARKEIEDFLKNKTFRTTTRKMRTKNGKIKYIKMTGKIAGEGNNELMIGTLQDVTVDVKLQQALKTKNLALERSNKELESFSYIASHDLQEPVRKINTFANLIRQKDKGQLSPAIADYLDRISTSAHRMQGLIEDFLNYSRLERSAMVFEKTNLNDVLEDVKNTYNELIQEKKTLISSEKLPEIAGIRFQLQQLFANLIGNSLKYHKPDVPPKVEISYRVVTGKEMRIRGVSHKRTYHAITFTDHGIGFEQQYNEKIFEVFQRLHSKDQYAGTGIGLAICKKIVTSHGGYIRAKGQVNVGSVFEIFIPTDLQENNAATSATEK